MYLATCHWWDLDRWIGPYFYLYLYCNLYANFPNSVYLPGKKSEANKIIDASNFKIILITKDKKISIKQKIDE